MTANTSPITVEIFGHTYKIRGVRNRETLERLASYVDNRMTSVAEQTGATDTLKIAILTALNIADEYFQAAERASSHPDETTLKAVEAKIEEITHLLDSCTEHDE